MIALQHQDRVIVAEQAASLPLRLLVHLWKAIAESLLRKGRPLVLQFIDPSVYSRYPALFSHRALLKNLPVIRKVLMVFIIQPYSCQRLLPPIAY